VRRDLQQAPAFLGSGGVRILLWVYIQLLDVCIENMRKNGPFLSAFPMFVPSLSW
jgi:hypothetical protein